MNSILTFCLIVAAVLAVGSSGQEIERFCRPGESRDAPCGPCKCNDEGTAEECTNVNCLPGLTYGEHSENRGRRVERATGGCCVPGTQFMIDCNTCTCPASGNRAEAACTLMACPPGLSSGFNRPSARPLRYRQRYQYFSYL